MNKLILIFLFAIIGCLRNENGGLSIQVPAGEETISEKNKYVIKTVVDGGTGYLAGLQDEDTIISVDGVNLNGLKENYVVQNLLRGKVGTLITLEIERDGKLLIFTIPRGNIVTPD